MHKFLQDIFLQFDAEVQHTKIEFWEFAKVI